MSTVAAATDALARDVRDSLPTETSGFWFEEEVTPDLAYKMRLKSITFNADSKFQNVQVAETHSFGQTLVLDSKTQSAAFDEHIYHESLVHTAMLLHPNPKTVFIGGGGELATAREVLRHPSVEHVVMVDIDQDVVEICERELPSWGNGCRKDKRLSVFFEDAYGFLERAGSSDGNCGGDTPKTYDVVIMDIADPIEAGPGIALYTKEFYSMMISSGRLAENGVLVSQSGPGSVLNATECMSTIHQTMRSVFDHVVPYNAEIPSFGSKWGFNVCFNDSLVRAAQEESKAGAGQGGGGEEEEEESKAGGKKVDCLSCFFQAGDLGLQSDINAMLEIPTRHIDKLVAQRLKKGQTLKFYDGISYKGMFGLARKIREALAGEKRIMTKDNPVFMH